jgi:hypothetical protein
MNNIFLRFIYILIIAYFLPGCTAQKVISAIETDLKKGVSNRIDVQRSLGAPQGFG